ncbi:phosphoglycerate dehydrogenase [Phragmitibacter flavus]|uniref:D-3-phosphoglycerate dehydrogenase n=1 Tax=Phragmitibacter flavus TaxID=2576071 RepID=A0A5R8KGR1_9BACT|nr:phosphoglycerate dehydrogenase [Phragmitibacter flavus]TLD71421.1 phosphoglycerate dehydrogenase [Phragmitibacter flavus]
MSDKHRILVADPISQTGIDLLQAEPSFEVEVKLGLKEAEFCEAAKGVSAIVVRSGVKVTAKVLEAADKLKVVGRAGVGVDNIDIPAASKRGVVVMNTPGGNTVSTAEHAFALMSSLARKIPQAHATVIAGRWDRKHFQGTELNHKVLAVLGMGRIGAEFAKRAKAFGMTVIAYDPYLSANRAQLLGVELRDNLDDAVKDADFITMHMPLTNETKHMLNETRMRKIKKGVRIINCARGGLVDDNALAKLLEEGHVAGAALDVFEVEPPPADYPVLHAPNVVFTPHLGASTGEAQESVGIEIAEQVKDNLLHGTVVNAVNMPNVDPKTLAEIGPFLRFGEILGRLISQIAPQRVEKMRINYSGKLGELDTTLISRGVLKGYLEKPIGADQVNLINAMSTAENLGLKFTESRLPGPTAFNDLIEVHVSNGEDTAVISGSFFGGDPRIVKINGRHVEARPEGTLLLIENDDRPGMIGAYGTILGKNQVNIANMSLSRNVEGGTALTLLTLDSVPTEAVIKELEQIPGVIKIYSMVLE